ALLYFIRKRPPAVAGPPHWLSTGRSSTGSIRLATLSTWMSGASANEAELMSSSSGIGAADLTKQTGLAAVRVKSFVSVWPSVRTTFGIGGVSDPLACTVRV